MSSVNKVILVGNLGRDPEIRTFPNGDQVCNATLATTDKWKDKTSGDPREATEWHRLQFTGRLAEIAGQYLKKGMQVYIEGQIRTRKYNDKDGVEKYATDIRVDQMQMLGSKNSSAPAGGDGDEAGAAAAPAASKASAAPARAPAASPAAAPKSSSGFDDMDDDIPF